MRGKQNQKVGNENPGPGNYDTTFNKNRVISHKIDSKSSRT
jgi:hypothetical protein